MPGKSGFQYVPQWEGPAGQVTGNPVFGELSIIPKADEVYHPGQIVDRFHDPSFIVEISSNEPQTANDNFRNRFLDPPLGFRRLS